MPYFELVRTMQYTETAYVKANSKEEADQMFGNPDIFGENYDFTNYDNNTYEITEQEYEENNMSGKYSPENVKVFIGDKEITGWDNIYSSRQGKPLMEEEMSQFILEDNLLKGMQFSVECELSEEDMQNMMEDLRVSIYNSEVGE